MRKGFLILSSASLLFSMANIAASALRPLTTISLGEGSINTYLNQNITLISPFQNSYESNGSNTQPLAGLFLGAEQRVLKGILAQVGVGYYQNKSFAIEGDVYQFADPAMNNLTYRYYVKSQRLLVEGKLLFDSDKKVHPFITAGAGEAINQAYQYVEIPLSTDVVPMAPGFNNQTNHSLTYEVGLGLDIDINDHVRCGVAYRFVDLGKAGLGTTPLQDGNQTITYNHLYENEVLLQLSYVG